MNYLDGYPIIETADFCGPKPGMLFYPLNQEEPLPLPEGSFINSWCVVGAIKGPGLTDFFGSAAPDERLAESYAELANHLESSAETLRTSSIPDKLMQVGEEVLVEVGESQLIDKQSSIAILGGLALAEIPGHEKPQAGTFISADVARAIGYHGLDRLIIMHQMPEAEAFRARVGIEQPTAAVHPIQAAA